MSPVNPHVITHLRQTIYYHLDSNLPENALFFAGRLHAYDPRSSEAAYLEALCHLRLGHRRQAYDRCRIPGSKGIHLGCSYILAQTCHGLERYSEGIHAIERSRGLWATRSNWGKHSDTQRQPLPDAAAMLCLQGKLFQAYRETTKAIDCYAETLKLNPFMWDAFVGLCDLGINIRISNIFQINEEMNYCLNHPPSNEHPPAANEETIFSNAPLQNPPMNHAASSIPSQNDPFSVSKNRVNGEVKNNLGGLALFEKFNGSKNIVTPVGVGGGLEFSSMDTPTNPGGIEVESVTRHEGESLKSTSMQSQQPPFAPLRRQRTMQGVLNISTDGPPKMRSNTMRSKSRSKPESDETEGPPLSRSSTISNGIGDRKRTVSGQVAHPATTVPNNVLNPANPNDTVPPSRRSMRLFNKPSAKLAAVTGSLGTKESRELKRPKAPITKPRSANASNVGRIVSGNRNMTEHGRELQAASNGAQIPPAPPPKPQINERVREKEALDWLLDLLSRLGGGYFALSHYRTQEALQIFNSITFSQRETPWVFAQIGRTLYEQGSYPEAEKYFTTLRQRAPSQLQDMEVYSTILWHLKNDIELAFLAHELLALDRLSPQAWCTVGNSFSLQRDHDQALKCFKRATQLDPTFAYAFTLQGHEYVATEEYDKALAAYRAAIAAETRHYNAWYGLGKVYEKQGKYPLAETHYLNALTINPTNAVLVCCIGVVLEKLKNPKAALVQYAKSVELAPKSALARFKKARVLMGMGELGAALGDLKVLKEIAPDEANVHFLLGRCYRGLGDRGLAIRCFTEALNLDPKASHYIKEAMEQMEDEVDDDDDEINEHDAAGHHLHQRHHHHHQQQQGEGQEHEYVEDPDTMHQ